MLQKGLKNIIYSIGGQMITLIIGIFIPRLVILSYGSDVNGLLSSVGSVISYLSLLEAGISMLACQALYGPIARDDRAQINRTLAAASYHYRRTGILYAGVLLLIALVYPFIIQSDLHPVLVFALVLICGAPNVITYLFQKKYLSFLEATGDYYVVVNVQTVLGVVASVLKIVLLQCGFNVIVVQAMYCLISLAQMIYIYCYIKRHYDWIDLRCEKDDSGMKQRGGALLHQICSLVTNSTDTIVLTLFCPLYVVSIYSLYNMLYNIVYNAVYTVNGSLAFALGQAFQRDREYYKKLIDVYETGYVTLSAALMTVTYIFITPFLKLYTAGADVNYIDFWLPLLFLAVKLINSIRNASLNTISLSGHFTDTAKYAVIESVINLVISVAAVWAFGLPGILVGTGVAFTYRGVVSVWFSNKKVLERHSVHSIRVAVVNVALVTGFVVLFNWLNLSFDNYFIMILVAVGMAFGALLVFGAVNALADPAAAKFVFSVVRRKLKRT